LQEDIQTQVLGVRSEPSRDGRSIKHIIEISGGQAASGTISPAGEYTAFEPQIEAAARAAVGTGFTQARVEIVQKEGYSRPFFNIKGINSTTGVAQPAPTGTPVQATPTQTPQPTLHPVAAQGGEFRSQENRRSAIHAAVEHITTLVQSGAIPPAEAGTTLQRTVEEFVRFIETGSFTDTSPIVPTATTPQEVVAQLPAEAPVQVGVPFDATPAGTAA